MAVKRPLGLKILGGLIIVGSLISMITIFLFIIGVTGKIPKIDVEKMREQYFRDHALTEKNITEFENMAPQLEKMNLAEKAIIAHPVIRGLQWWNLLVSIILLVLGIGLLMLKEKARSAMIIFQPFFVVSAGIETYLSWNIIYDLSKKYEPDFPGTIPKSLLVLGPAIFKVLIVGAIAALIIWYLNRLKVKEQFA